MRPSLIPPRRSPPDPIAAARSQIAPLMVAAQSCLVLHLGFRVSGYRRLRRRDVPAASRFVPRPVAPAPRSAIPNHAGPLIAG